MAEINPELSPGKNLSGQTAQNEIGFVIPFIEWMQPYHDNGSGIMVTGFEDDPAYDITPIDANQAKVRLTDTAAILTLLETIVVAVPTTIPRIDFPDTLTSVVTTVNDSTGAGADSHPVANISLTVYGSGSGGIDPTSSSQGSASIIPDATPVITQRYHQNVAAMEYTFYLADTASFSDITTRLTAIAGAAVQFWPQFKPVAHTIVCNGMQVTVGAKADTHIHFGGDTTNGEVSSQWGNGTSSDVSVVTKTIRVSPTIHGIITITAPSPASATAAATAEASTPIIGGVIPAVTNTASKSQNATASVTIDGGSSVAATVPASIPTSGLYIYSLNPGPLTYGAVIFQAVVVNFATL